MAISIQLKRVSTLVLMVGVIASGFAALGQEAEPSKPGKDKPPSRTDRYGDPLPRGAITRLGTMRLRPCHEVYFLAALPDGKRVLTIAKKFEENADAEHEASAEQKVVVCVWRMATGELLLRFELPISGVSAALSPNGKYLVTAGSSKPDWVSHVLFWDVDTGKKIGELRGAPQLPNQVFALCFAGDGKTLATTDGGSMFRLWDTEKRKQLRCFKGGKNQSGLLALSRDGKVLALMSDQLELWDTASGKQLHSYPLVETGGQGMAFSPDGKLLATAGTHGTIRLMSGLSVAKRCSACSRQGITICWNLRAARRF